MADVFTPFITFGPWSYGLMTPTAPGIPYMTLQPASGSPPAAPVLAGSFAPAFLNTAYSSSLTITGGTAPYTYTLVSGTLPTGLSLAVVGSSLVLSGTPTVGGSYTFAVKVTDNNGTGVDSNIVTTTGMIVNVFAAPTFSAMMGRRNRARTGAILGNYLGPIATYATDLTIVSGNSLGHWQLQNQVINGTNSLTDQAVGLAPMGNPSNNMWDAWPGTSGGTLQNSYSVVVQHTATGQQCTININCDAATTQTWNDRTYNLGNAFVIACEAECRNFGSIGANNYITRNANEGGWLILRDGVYLGSANPTYGFFWIGQGSYAGGSVAFSQGTFSKNAAPDGASIFQETHGDRSSGRIVEGWQGGNYTLVRPETPFGARVTNLQQNIQGLFFAQIEFITPAASGMARYGLGAKTADCVADCCYFHCAPSPTASNKYGFFGTSQNPFPRYQTSLNSYFYDLDEGHHSYFIEPYVAGNIFDKIRADDCNMGVDNSLAAFPVGGTVNGYFGFNISLNNDTAGGAHPDVCQYYVAAFTTVGGTIPGTFELEKNMNLTTSQFCFNGGSAATASLISSLDHNNMSIVGNFPGQHSCVLQATRTDYCNTSLFDLNGADYNPANPPAHTFGSGNVNVTCRDNIAHRFDAPNASGTVVYDQTGANTSSGFNALLTNTNTAYAGYFANPLGAGSGGIVPYTASIHTWQAAWNAGIPLFVPKNALAGAGGLKRADTTGPGALKPGSTASTPIWNDGTTAW